MIGKYWADGQVKFRGKNIILLTPPLQPFSIYCCRTTKLKQPADFISMHIDINMSILEITFMYIGFPCLPTHLIHVISDQTSSCLTKFGLE